MGLVTSKSFQAISQAISCLILLKRSIDFPNQLPHFHLHFHSTFHLLCRKLNACPSFAARFCSLPFPPFHLQLICTRQQVCNHSQSQAGGLNPKLDYPTQPTKRHEQPSACCPELSTFVTYTRFAAVMSSANTTHCCHPVLPHTVATGLHSENVTSWH